MTVARYSLTMSSELDLPQGYSDALRSIKQQVQDSRRAAQRVVNTELVHLYWRIGQTILDQQEERPWGSGVVGHLADDLRSEFPDARGFSRRNLLYMRSFADAWPALDPKVPQAVALLPWGHIRLLLDKVEEQSERSWYAAAAAEHGWSRNVLQHQIANKLIHREGAAPSNFATHLEKPDSDLARQLAKDPYVFDFLGLGAEADEPRLEQALMDRMVEVLRELGTGWAFVDRQRHVEVDDQDFYIDLLFFHVEQLRYIVIELKSGPFKPEHVGQLGFYVNVVDDLIRKDQHAPTVGILLVADKSEAVVRYALGGATQPMAVSSYTYETLPEDEKAALPAEDKLAHALEAKRPGEWDELTSE